MSLTRRALLTVAAAALPCGPALAAALDSAAGRSDEDVARDEAFWRAVRAEFPNDRALLHLNHAAIGSAPRTVLEAVRAYDDMLALQPTHYYYDVIEPHVEGVRRQLAAGLGCEPDELAITRNASEGLAAAVFGLDLRRGDEVVTTMHDYPNVLECLRQRAARDGIVVRQVPVPIVPDAPGQLLAAIDGAWTARTRAVVFCHVTSMTGLRFPAADICALARARGALSVVDGAQSVGQIDFAVRDIGCDVFATSLHKYFCGPVGTGALAVRREVVERIWPPMGAPAAQQADVRKFEALGPGTIRLAPRTALPVAVEFNERIGVSRKAARLSYLMHRWMDRLERVPGLRLLTSRDARLGAGFGSFLPPGVTAQHLVDTLMRQYRIHVRARGVPGEFTGVRVSPNVFTSAAEIDTFCEAAERVLQDPPGG